MDKQEFSLRYAEDGIFLTINSTVNPFICDEIYRYLNRKQVKGYDKNTITNLVHNVGVEEKIAEAAPEIKLDEEATITISKDLCTAYISFLPAYGGKLLTAPQIVELLKAARVVHGVDSSVLTLLAGNADKLYDQPIEIAHATLPVKGNDAQIHFNFQIERDKTPKILENGHVDHRELDYVKSVNKGDVLATLTPADSGTSGINVLGIEMKTTPGKPKTLPSGKNTQISEDGLKLLATAEGIVDIKNGRIMVLQVLEIKGDVGVPTGHIYFPGDVIISGNVISNYNVSAAGSITVDGCVEASIIEAGGDVIIHQGIKGLSAQGLSKCQITSGGNITAKFIENAVVYASGVIRADMIIHSFVSSNDTVIASGKHGNIIGGTVRALKEIVCENAGVEASLATIQTNLEVGITPGTSEKLHELEKEIETIQLKLEEMNLIILELEANEALNSKQYKRLQTLLSQKEAYLDQMATKNADVKQIHLMHSKSGIGRVHVRNAIYPPSTLTIGNVVSHFDTKQTSATYRLHEGKIDTIPFDYSGK